MTPADKLTAMCAKLPRTEEPTNWRSWYLITQQVDSPDHVQRWDVFLLHEKGARVPAGPNLFTIELRDAEKRRLTAVLDR